MNQTAEDFFKTSCPKCGQHVEISNEYYGQSANCPTCARSFTAEIRAPAPVARQAFYPHVLTRRADPGRWIAWGLVALIFLIGNIAMVGPVMGLVYLAGQFTILFFYMLPAYVGRNKKNATAILVLNLFLGWTLIGWVVALVWANTVDA